MLYCFSRKEKLENMYGIKVTKRVANIIRSKETIMDQMLELRNNFYNKGVRQYIDRLIFSNVHSDSLESKYILYCIAKYIFGLEVKEVGVPLPKLPMASYGSEFHYDADALNALLSQKEDIIEQCKLLREHKNMKGLEEYFECVFEWYDYDVALANQSRDFEIYCINRYFYGLDVSEVKPRPLDLRPFIRERVVREKVEIPVHFTDFLEIKKRDKVKILTGPFTNLIGTVTDINPKLVQVTVSIELFGQEDFIEIDMNQDKVLRVDDEV